MPRDTRTYPPRRLGFGGLTTTGSSSLNVLNTNQLRNGNHIEVDGTVFKVLEFQHVKPGKGGAFVRTKLRRAADGAGIDKTFPAGEKVPARPTGSRKKQVLYPGGTHPHFLGPPSHDPNAIPPGTG